MGKKLKYEFSEWEVMVLRAAIEGHKRATKLPKHTAACIDILQELRKNDKPTIS